MPVVPDCICTANYLSVVCLNLIVGSRSPAPKVGVAPVPGPRPGGRGARLQPPALPATPTKPPARQPRPHALRPRASRNPGRRPPPPPRPLRRRPRRFSGAAWQARGGPGAQRALDPGFVLELLHEVVRARRRARLERPEAPLSCSPNRRAHHAPRAGAPAVACTTSRDERVPQGKMGRTAARKQGGSHPSPASPCRRGRFSPAP